MRIGVLGPLELDEANSQLGARDRIVLSALAMSPGELLTPEQLADAVWGEEPPTSWSKNVQGCVSRLRKRLGADAIETSAHGYRLRVPADTVDAIEFTRAARRSRELLTLKEFEHARYVATQALELWRGRPLADLEQWETGATEARRLCEVHAELEELAVESSLAAGHHREVLAQAAAMVEAAPMRERRWILLARAQYQSGDQHGALRTVRRLRAVLQHELGIDPGPELVAFEQAILRQDPELLVEPAAEADEAVSPYLGLTPYGEEDAESFFGREADITTCLRRLATVPLLAVVGPSGSGKSSLLRAGLAPALRRERADVRVLTPGRHPMDALTAVKARKTSIILVDQAEEAFSLCLDEEERERFFTALVSHTERGRVVLALRADFTGELSAYHGLATLVERGLFLLPVMSSEALRAAIEGPAHLHGLVVEPGLTDLLVREVEGEPGALPLLSHALRETWLRHEGRTLTVSGYQASGGIRGAVAQSAEQLYGQVGEDERALLRELVLRLIVPGPEGEAVRGRVPRHQAVVAQEQDHLVDMMIGARLVTSDDGVIELAHEAVVRAWPRLRDWLEDDLEGQRMRHRLTLATEDWSTLGFQDSELYRGARLAAVREWVDSTHPQLTADEQRFVDASAELAAAEERSAAELARTRGRMVRRLRVALVASTILLVLALVTGFVAVGQTRKADRSALAADAGRVGAQALVTTDITDSLLTAVAAARLDPSPMTERDLDAALAQHPELVGSVPVPAHGNTSYLAVSPDGRTLAVADTSHHIWTYDAHTLAPITDDQVGQQTQASDDTLLAYSPTRQALAVGAPPSEGGLVRLLDPNTLQPLTRQLGGWPHRWGQLVGLGYSANGKYLAAGDLAQGGGFASAPTNTHGTALVWDMSKPGLPLVHQVKLADTGITEVQPSSDGKTLYVTDSDGGPLTAYNLTTGKQRFQTSQGVGPLVALDPTGHLVAAATVTNSILLSNARTGHPIRTLRGPTGGVDQMTFSHDGSELAATARDKTVTVWDDETGSVIQNINDGAQFADGVAFSPDGSTLFTTADDADEIHAWDLSGLRSYVSSIPIRQPLNLGVGSIKPSPRGDVLATNGFDQNSAQWALWFVDLAAGTRTRLRGTGLTDSSGSWSPDDERYAAGYQGGWIRVFQRGDTRAVVRRRILKHDIFEVSYTPDGRRLVATDNRGNVVMVDAATLRPVGRSLHIARTQTTELSAGPDNHTAFVTGSVIQHHWGWSDPVNRWWLVDLLRGKVLEHGQLDVTGTYNAFSPRGDRVAVGGLGGTVELLDLTTGRPVRPPVLAHDGDVNSVTFNADGSRIASASNAGDLALWDGHTGQLLSTARVPGAQRATVVGFRPDGTVTAASFGGEAYHWNPSLGHAIAVACHAAGRDMTQAEWAAELPGRRYRSVCPATG
jgi:WD40 repeat protein/DNA-binding SARP family transcriptional activator